MIENSHVALRVKLFMLEPDFLLFACLPLLQAQHKESNIMSYPSSIEPEILFLTSVQVSLFCTEDKHVLWALSQEPVTKHRYLVCHS